MAQIQEVLADFAGGHSSLRAKGDLRAGRGGGRSGRVGGRGGEAGSRGSEYRLGDKTAAIELG